MRLGYFFICFSIKIEDYNKVFFFSLCIHQKQHVILQLFWVMSLPHPQNKLIWSGRVWPCHAQVGCRKKAKQKSCAVLASAGIQHLRLSDATRVCRKFLLNTNQVLGFNYCLHLFFWIVEAVPTQPSLLCKPWEKPAKDQCVCKMPYECK